MSTKKNIKVRDLKPSKDAKGGGVSRQGASHQGVSHQGASHQGASHQAGASRNTHTHQHGGGTGHH
jgi:microtubule-associated protein, RP/EB family